MLKSHTGENLARAAFDLFNDFGIAGRTLGHAGDNASNNDSMLDSLDELYRTIEESIAGRTTQIRCFGHILNLVYHVSCQRLADASLTEPTSQAICSQFEPLKKKTTRAATLAADADDCDEWEDDPEDDEDDELYEQAAEEKIEKERGELEEVFKDPDLERLWQASPRAKVPQPTVEEVKDGLSAMQKVRPRW